MKKSVENSSVEESQNTSPNNPIKKVFTSRMFWGCSAGAISLIIVVSLGIILRTSDSASGVKKPSIKQTTTTTSTTTTTTVPQTLIQPAPANLPLVGPGGSIGSGANNANVALYEQRLVDLKFDPGPVDTKYDSKTVYAIQALQKIKGIPITGKITDTEVQILNTYQYDLPLTQNAEANRLEVSLDKQFAIYYENYQVRLVTTVSTGNGKNYCYVNKQSRRVCSKANTPTGRFTFERKISGWRDGDLGLMYAPMYFKGGVAVHGYKSVPTTPASHGCVRIPMHIAEYFQTVASIGDPVYVVASVSVPYVADKVGGVVTAAPTTTAPPSTEPSTTTTTTTAPTTTPTT